MPILTLVYSLLIGPLELFFEVVYAIALRVVDNPGLAIIVLSLAMNVLVLPLYRRADAVQEAERDRAMAMKPWVDHIKKTFKGDEQFMMLQTYYRQVGYKQTDQLKGSISLLLEIPFFIAAYHFLSNLELLRGVPFGPITDLGAPDGLLQLGDVTLNALPIIMTAINVVSAAIYLKGFPLSSKIQTYGIAAIFLILLYTSPAGLVFYWTLNNIFSLVKNVFYKLKNPRKVLAVLLAVLGAGLLVFVVGIHPMSSKMRQLFMVLLAVVLMLPLIALAVEKLRAGKEKAGRKSLFPEDPKVDDRVFLYASIFLAVLTGFLIPSSVIAASPAEFVDMTNVQSPLWYVARSFCLAVGTFVIWFGVFYRLATPRGKAVFGYAMWALVGIAIVDYLAFGTDYGTLSASLKFDTAPEIVYAGIFMNLAAVAGAAVALYVIWRLKRPFAKVACLSLCVAAIAMSAYNAYGITQGVASIDRADATAGVEDRPHFTMSTTGKNVVFIMMDRAVSYYVPFILNERPDIAEKLEGFTFYSNTVSYGHGTQVGSPPLYGGYDYIPENTNKRDDVALVDKQNEALKVMPGLLYREGYDVTVFDPTYANYEWIPDLSIYDEFPGMNAYITMDGSFRYADALSTYEGQEAESSRERNFFCYSLFKIAPVALHRTLYDDGNYNSTDSVQQAEEQTQFTNSTSVGTRETFLDSYGVLCSMPDITVKTDEDVNTFLMMSNDTAHEPMLLKEPEYVPAWEVDNTEYDQQHAIRTSTDGREMSLEEDQVGNANNKMMHYHINAAALDKLGDWCDYLRENGLYDNTRIVIVSDHGKDISPIGDVDLHIFNVNYEGQDDTLDLMAFTSLLMVKDFDSRESTTDDTFMTNADAPALTLQGLVDDPRNPYTGNPIDTLGKEQYPVRVYYLVKWWLSLYDNGTYSYDPGYWLEVHDNVYDINNWENLGYY